MYPSSTFDIAGIVGIVVAVACVIGFAFAPQGKTLRLIVCGVGGMFALAVVLGPRFVGTRVVIIDFPSADRPARKRHMMYFSPRDYVFADGHATKLPIAKGTLIVNDTNRTLRLQTIQYGSSAMPTMGGAPIAPMSILDAEFGIDWIGPDDAPPAEIQSKHSSEIKHWLTW